MSKRACQWCSGPIAAAAPTDTRFCSTRCRVASHRACGIPQSIRKSRRWVRADGKRPVMVDGRPASSTDQATWSSWTAVSNSGAGDGFGVMLGGGLGCYDLDHVGAEQARELIAGIPERVLFVEWSMSGRGVHVFVEAPEGPGHRAGQVERYTRARFIRMTGRRFE